MPRGAPDGGPGSDPNLVAVVLAAGQGKRMKSSLVKVLHRLRGRPLVQHVLDAVRGAGASRVIVVVGVQAERVRQALEAEGVEFAHQDRPLGTAHAVLCARPLLEGYRGDVLVVYGDTPLLAAGDLRALVEARRGAGAALAFLTTHLPDPTGYGRVIRDASGRVVDIVEEADCTPPQRAIDEVNAGVYCFLAPGLWSVLEQVGRGNAQGEFYLTDAVRIMAGRGDGVVTVSAPRERMEGVSDRADLARLESAVRRSWLEALMRQGVAVVDPASAYVGECVEVDSDAVIAPVTVVDGRVRIRKGATVGPLAVIKQRDRG